MNTTTAPQLPPLPSYTLHPLPPLIPGISDKVLAMILPIAAYWILSLFFYYIDEYDIWPQYRLHTPAELLQRNHATRFDVFRDVILQQIVQTIFGLAMTWFDPEETYGKEGYDVAVWAQRLRMLQTGIPKIMGLVGLDSMNLGASIAKTYPTLAGPLLGGHYPGLFESIITESGAVNVVPAFAQWELLTAKAIYYLVIPAIQFLVAITWIDTWQYMLHRAMHTNKFLYTWLHSRHHRLYVPYAFGALYNHPLEGFALDTLGTGLAYLAARMTTRQSMLLFAGSTFKTVDDHCGYALPWDPIQHITSNNAAYHDIHHQSWGIKTNFSQPFFTFWDAFLGTRWNGGDVTARYERAKLAAQKKYDAGLAAKDKTLEAIAIPGNEDPAKNTKEPFDYSNNISTSDDQQTLAERVRQEKEQEIEARQMVTRSARKKSAGAKSGDSLKGLRERVVGGGGSPHGGRSTILHAEGGH